MASIEVKSGPTSVKQSIVYGSKEAQQLEDLSLE